MPDFFDLSFFDRTKFACDPIVTRRDMDSADLHQHVSTFTKIGILDGPNEEVNFKYFAGRPDFEVIRPDSKYRDPEMDPLESLSELSSKAVLLDCRRIPHREKMYESLTRRKLGRDLIVIAGVPHLPSVPHVRVEWPRIISSLSQDLPDHSDICMSYRNAFGHVDPVAFFACASLPSCDFETASRIAWESIKEVTLNHYFVWMWITFTAIDIVRLSYPEVNSFSALLSAAENIDIRETLFGDVFLQIPQQPPLHWDVQKLIENGVFYQKFVDGRLTWHISPFYLIGLRKVRYDQGTKKFFRDGDTSC